MRNKNNYASVPNSHSMRFIKSDENLKSQRAQLEYNDHDWMIYKHIKTL